MKNMNEFKLHLDCNFLGINEVYMKNLGNELKKLEKLYKIDLSLRNNGLLEKYIISLSEDLKSIRYLNYILINVSDN